MDLSVPTILPPWVQDPSTSSILFSFTVFVLYLSCENNENKLKEAGLGPFLEKKENIGNRLWRPNESDRGICS